VALACVGLHDPSAAPTNGARLRLGSIALFGRRNSQKVLSYELPLKSHPQPKFLQVGAFSPVSDPTTRFHGAAAAGCIAIRSKTLRLNARLS
jgi:hypothetical protein